MLQNTGHSGLLVLSVPHKMCPNECKIVHCACTASYVNALQRLFQAGQLHVFSMHLTINSVLQNNK